MDTFDSRVLELSDQHRPPRAAIIPEPADPPTELAVTAKELMCSARPTAHLDPSACLLSSLSAMVEPAEPSTYPNVRVLYHVRYDLCFAP